jgi:hypothetical protein
MERMIPANGRRLTNSVAPPEIRSHHHPCSDQGPKFLWSRLLQEAPFTDE